MYNKIVAALASKRFFYAIIALFVVQAAWIALSGRYPMAFDEDFHLGIIRLYAEQWSPFFASQPTGADTFGAVVRDPSYLHHYLLAFPYRFSDWLFQSDFINVMVLRAFGIGFMTAGLIIFRRLLRRAVQSDALVHGILLLFILTPVVPFLAAQINYDNLLFPVAGLVLLLTMRFAERLRSGHFDTPRLVALLSAGMMASLIKYAFLPVLFGVVVFVGLELKRALRRKQVTLRRLVRDAWTEATQASRPVKAGMVAALAVSGGLFIAMYGYNFVAYRTPVPECNQVLNAERCTAYGAWFRNYQYAQTKGDVNPDPIQFTRSWGGTYVQSAFFAVNGIYSGFVIAPPLPVLHTAALGVALLAIPLVIWQRRRLWQTPLLRLFLVVCTIYGTALWVQNYGEYLNLGRHVAEHGRYWVILLIPVYTLLAIAYRFAVHGNRKLLLGGAIVVGLVFTQGGGALTYISRSDPTWWWQDNRLAPALNESVQPLVRPWLLGSDRPNIKPWEQPQR